MNPIHESWQQGWNVVGWTMLYFLAAGTVVLLLGGVLRVLLRRATPNIRYATSLATFAALALLPLVIAPQIPAPELTTKITKDTKVEFTPQPGRPRPRLGPRRQGEPSA